MSENSQAKNTHSLVSDVIKAGKSAVGGIADGQLAQFIAAQPEVEGEVRIQNARSAGDVGASSGIVLFTAEYRHAGALQRKELVLRYAPESSSRLFFEYDLERQFKVQQAMFRRGLAVPEAYWLDKTSDGLGVKGYIMEFKQGVAPHPSAFVMGPIAEASPAQRESMLMQIMSSLVTIHNTDIAAYDLNDFAMNAAGNTAFERCINWYWNTWEWIDIAQYARLEPIHSWLLKNAPTDPPELTHGDSTLHNYMFSDHRLVAIVDWEMSCLGRAESDLALQCVGNALFAADPASGALQPPSESQWLEMYQAAGGRAPKDFDYYKKFAAYMVVVAIAALQRNMDESSREAQSGLLRPLWEIIES